MTHERRLTTVSTVWMLEGYALERIWCRYRGPVGPEGAKALFEV
jgi:hypothetical protein